MSAYSQDTSSIHGIDVLNRLGALVKNTGSFGFGLDINKGSTGFYGAGQGLSGLMGSGSYSGSGQLNSGSGSYSGSGSNGGYSSSYSS